MFDKNDEKYLLRQLSNNQVVLFLGAGFSREAKNKLLENFPTGSALGSKIWKILGYRGDYDDTPLPQMYQAFLKSSLKKNEKHDFLEQNLLTGEIPEMYDSITIPYWFKIYTINIDDIIPNIYKRTGKQINILKYPKDQYSERDQSLEKAQVIYLHGQLPCKPEDVIFSTQQYAKAQLAHQPLYGQFVYDYATLPTLFIGTEMDEPIFEKYIEAREGKFGFRELRPKSFLITPHLSPVKADNLKNNYNVFHIEGTTEEFFDWLNKNQSTLPSRKEILQHTFPNLLNILDYVDLSSASKKSILSFSDGFKRIPKEFKRLKERSGFLTGASPRWNDIVSELDIPRTQTKEIFEKATYLCESLDEKSKVNVITIVGSAGSGKSTMLKRLGLMISQAGFTPFLTYSEFLPRVNEMIDVLGSFNKRTILIFDNSNNVISQLPYYIDNFNKKLKFPPIIILGIRTNFSNKIKQYITPDISTNFDYRISDLDDNEIYHLIEKLDQNNLLGILKGMTESQRYLEFKNRAHRQILIAMKEATNGKSFNDIILDEFNQIEPLEAKILCSCIALNTQLGYSNSKQDLVGFSKVSPNEALNYLNTVLDGTILWVGNQDRFMLRHKILADFMIRSCINLEILKESYIRVLSILAPELKKTQGHNKKFSLYKKLIAHRELYRRFKSNIDHARDVYDSITSHFSDSSHFWLQYGSLEIEGEGGNLDFAENYLAQAESLDPESFYILTAKCNLFYRQSIAADSLEVARNLKEKADHLAHKLLLQESEPDPYIYHIYCSGRYKYVSRWNKNPESKKEELDNLKDSIKTALSFHPFNTKLIQIEKVIQRAYLALGTDERIQDPEIPDYLD